MPGPTDRPKLPHNRNGIISTAIFVGTFAVWLVALWLYSTKVEVVSGKDLDFIFWLDVATFVPFLAGTLLGVKGLYQRDTAPMFSFAGFALNGIMAFKVLYTILGVSW